MRRELFKTVAKEHNFDDIEEFKMFFCHIYYDYTYDELCYKFRISRGTISKWAKELGLSKRLKK